MRWTPHGCWQRPGQGRLLAQAPACPGLLPTLAPGIAPAPHCRVLCLCFPGLAFGSGLGTLTQLPSPPCCSHGALEPLHRAPSSQSSRLANPAGAPAAAPPTPCHPPRPSPCSRPSHGHPAALCTARCPWAPCTFPQPLADTVTQAPSAPLHTKAKEIANTWAVSKRTRGPSQSHGCISTTG